MNGISSVGSSVWTQRPDASQLASKLFSKLDTTNKGYLEKTDLQSAFSSIDSETGSDAASALFSKLDGDSNGKLTQAEMSDGLKKLTDELDQQFNAMRMEGGGRPPGPPPGGGTGGPSLSKDELQTQLSEIGTSDSERAAFVSSVIENFDEADSDGDGKVSFQEAMSFRDQQGGATSTSADNTASASTSAVDDERKLMMQIMKLIQAYGDDSTSNLSQTVSGLFQAEA